MPIASAPPGSRGGLRRRSALLVVEKPKPNDIQGLAQLGSDDKGGTVLSPNTGSMRATLLIRSHERGVGAAEPIRPRCSRCRRDRRAFGQTVRSYPPAVEQCIHRPRSCRRDQQWFRVRAVSPREFLAVRGAFRIAAAFAVNAYHPTAHDRCLASEGRPYAQGR